MRSLCVFCGSRAGGATVYADSARRFGELLAARGLALVVWIIAGAVSLAAVTGGVALMGRLAPKGREEDEEAADNPLE